MHLHPEKQMKLYHIKAFFYFCQNSISTYYTLKNKKDIFHIKFQFLQAWPQAPHHRVLPFSNPHKGHISLRKWIYSKYVHGKINILLNFLADTPVKGLFRGKTFLRYFTIVVVILRI